MEQAKKDCILVEAAKAFARFGFKKASIDQIAKMAGVAKGTVYLAAESKKDLFYQVLLREVQAWSAHVGKVVDPRVPAEQLLEQAAAASSLYLDDRPLLKSLLFGDAAAYMPGWTDRLDELIAMGRADVERILNLGIKQGRFRSNIDIEEVARILLDVQLSFFLMHDRDGPDRFERIERRKNAAMDLIRHGLVVRKPQALPA